MGRRWQAGRRRLTALGAAVVLLLIGAPATGAPDAPASAGAGDPLRVQQWGLDQVRAPQAWTRSRGAGALVAVLGTGVDLAHR